MEGTGFASLGACSLGKTGDWGNLLRLRFFCGDCEYREPGVSLSCRAIWDGNPGSRTGITTLGDVGRALHRVGFVGDARLGSE